jgi:hypothetical protein
VNPLVGWALAVLAVFVGWREYGVQGLVFGATLVVFWLVLQFSRALRVMRRAGDSPIGSVDSAVMLNAKLRKGMQLLQVLTLTRSLGRRVGDDVYAWADDGGSEVVVTFRNGRCRSWELRRPAEAPE